MGDGCVGWMDLGELEGRLNENFWQFCLMLVWGQLIETTQVSCRKVVRVSKEGVRAEFPYDDDNDDMMRLWW